MNLSEKKCVPCEGGLARLDPARAEALRAGSAPDWRIIEDSTKLFREFTFKNFRSAQDFVNKVGDIAEIEGHHPDIEFGWGYAKITIYTHAINGLHENDFILASKIDIIAI